MKVEKSMRYEHVNNVIREYYIAGAFGNMTIYENHRLQSRYKISWRNKYFDVPAWRSVCKRYSSDCVEIFYVDAQNNRVCSREILERISVLSGISYNEF